VAATTATAGVMGVDVGTVTVTDSSATVASVTLTNFGNSTVTSDALTSLSLTNASATGNKDGTVTVTNTKATTLDLTVNAGKGGIGTVDLGSTYTTLKVHTSGSDSTLDRLTAGGVTSLTIDGTNQLKLSANTLTNLKTVAVSGSASVNANLSASSSLTSVDASASTGNNSVTIGNGVTFAGGSGNDSLTVGAAPTAAISGGAGTDTLTLNFAGGAGYASWQNVYTSGFETLGLGASGSGTYDATGFTALTLGGVTADVVFTNVAAGATLALTANPGFNTTYTLKDATGSSDALTVNASHNGGTFTGGTVTASGIESVTLNINDTASNAKAGGNSASITLSDAAATKIVVTGNDNITLTSSNTAVTSVDASAVTGSFTYTAAGTVAETVKAGAGNSSLTASTLTGIIADTLIGGKGNDTLTANAGADTLTGGAGSDTFVVAQVTSNLNVYTTITDATAGDQIKLADKGTETFNATKVALAGTAVFADYANAVVNAGGNSATNGAIGWFQFGGDTYIVEGMHDATTTKDFSNGTDLVVKLSGLVDLSTATLFGALNTAAPVLVLH